jgi:hypothetical protein
MGFGALVVTDGFVAGPKVMKRAVWRVTKQ